MREPLYRRGKVWWCSVRDRRGKIVRRSTKCRDYQAACAALHEFERIAADPAHAAAAAAHLEGCLNDYLVELERRKVSAATLRKETQKIGHLVRLWKADLPMAGIDARLVADYIARREGEGVSRHTVKMELGSLARVLKVARHFGHFDRPIEQVMPIQYGPRHVPRTRWLTPLELKALLEELPTFRGAHVAFIVATGARLGESVRARRADVNQARTFVKLRGTKTSLAAAEVPITPLTRQLLTLALEHGPGRRADVPLFRPWGKIHRDLAAACARAGIPKAGPNDLRRTFGHWYRQAGLSPADIAPLLRHATDKLAQTTYARPRGEELARIVEGKLLPIGIVPDLYRPGVSTESNRTTDNDETSGIHAPPARVELATNALGRRSREHGPRARQRSSKVAAGEGDDGPTVPVLQWGVPCPECEGSGTVVVVDHGALAGAACGTCARRAAA